MQHRESIALGEVAHSFVRAPAYNPGRPTLAAATRETANRMTFHGKTWYPDIVMSREALAWGRRVQHSFGRFANAHGTIDSHQTCSTIS